MISGSHILRRGGLWPVYLLRLHTELCIPNRVQTARHSFGLLRLATEGEGDKGVGGGAFLIRGHQGFSANDLDLHMFNGHARKLFDAQRNCNVEHGATVMNAAHSSSYLQCSLLLHPLQANLSEFRRLLSEKGLGC